MSAPELPISSHESDVSDEDEDEDDQDESDRAPHQHRDNDDDFDDSVHFTDDEDFEDDDDVSVCSTGQAATPLVHSSHLIMHAPTHDDSGSDDDDVSVCSTGAVAPLVHSSHLIMHAPMHDDSGSDDDDVSVCSTGQAAAPLVHSSHLIMHAPAHDDSDSDDDDVSVCSTDQAVAPLVYSSHLIMHAPTHDDSGGDDDDVSVCSMDHAHQDADEIQSVPSSHTDHGGDDIVSWASSESLRAGPRHDEDNPNRCGTAKRSRASISDEHSIPPSPNTLASDDPAAHPLPPTDDDSDRYSRHSADTAQDDQAGEPESDEDELVAQRATRLHDEHVTQFNPRAFTPSRDDLGTTTTANDAIADILNNVPILCTKPIHDAGIGELRRKTMSWSHKKYGSQKAMFLDAVLSRCSVLTALHIGRQVISLFEAFPEASLPYVSKQKYKLPRGGDVKCLVLNCRSLNTHGKAEALVNQLLRHDVDVAFLNEIWNPTPAVKGALGAAGFSCVWNPRAEDVGGGTAVLPPCRRPRESKSPTAASHRQAASSVPMTDSSRRFTAPQM